MSDVNKDAETVAALVALLSSVRDQGYLQGINARQKKMLFVLRHKAEMTRLKAEGGLGQILAWTCAARGTGLTPIRFKAPSRNRLYGRASQ